MFTRKIETVSIQCSNSFWAPEEPEVMTLSSVNMLRCLHLRKQELRERLKLYSSDRYAVQMSIYVSNLLAQLTNIRHMIRFIEKNRVEIKIEKF